MIWLAIIVGVIAYLIYESKRDYDEWSQWYGD